MSVSSVTPALKCRICGKSGNHQTVMVREMMFGLKEEFPYFYCSHCECLQIAEIPGDMSKYYRSDYYSFSSDPSRLYQNPLKNIVRRLRDNFAVFNKGLLGKCIHSVFPAETDLGSLSGMSLTKQSQILDVGCGTGFLLYFLKEAGFKNVVGVDPYIEGDIEYKNRLKVYKRGIRDVEGEWDLIMFHHSFEHVADPGETLHIVAKALAPGGWCLLRVPVVSSHAWEHYRADWVQLDAPRHFHLHSPKSIRMMAERENLKLEKIVYDSSDLQFWGSEQYRKDIPLMSDLSYGVNPAKSIFSSSEILAFKQKAKRLNRESLGDQAAFYLRKV